mmetsp:Transcript_24673/g.55577  ORF Transcript_24673/g.55577 Transcript_24673/m.55577 type:complete len:164 (-) Transcript_24673:254-745(-)
MYGSSELFGGLLVAECAVLLPTMVLIGQLLHFHTLLLRKRLTTYEYVTEQQFENRPQRQRPAQQQKPAQAPGKTASPRRERGSTSDGVARAAAAGGGGGGGPVDSPPEDADLIADLRGRDRGPPSSSGSDLPLGLLPKPKGANPDGPDEESLDVGKPSPPLER